MDSRPGKTGGRRPRPGVWAVVAMAMFAALGEGRADEPVTPAPTRGGVILDDPRALEGYTLIFPIRSTRTYLVDMRGHVARTWESRYGPGQEAYLLEDGHLLRPARMADGEAIFAGAGGGGRIQEFDAAGKIVWNFKFHNERQVQHHAITRMPNGHVMMIVWERKTPEESIAAGVNPEYAGQTDILVDSLVEVEPAGKTGGKVVWEWHLWDHLVQDHDRARANYGDVAAHPERIDANFERDAIHAALRTMAAAAPAGDDTAGKAAAKRGETRANDATFDRLKTIGYVGAGKPGSRKFQGFFPDWNHINSVSYNAKLDQLLISSRQFSEIYVIDHGTTTAEAAGHTGGRRGKGGDILYRWGNPRAYRAGTEADQRLFHQHDAQWIADGLPGAGHILVYNNGDGRPDGSNYSSVDEIVPPTADGRYERPPGKPFGPDRPSWTFTATNREDLFSPITCGAQRLPNGNTLLANGFLGSIWEVTPTKDVVWKYVVPFDMKPGTEIRPGGAGYPDAPSSPAGPKRPLQAFPAAVGMWLDLKPAQIKAFGDAEKQIGSVMNAMLTPEQRDRLKELENPRAQVAFRLEPEPAEILTPEVIARLGLTPEQKRRVDELRKGAYATIGSTLSSGQMRRFRTIVATRRSFAVGPDGPVGNAIFRAYRYPRGYLGLSRLVLQPGPTIDELATPKKPR